MAKLGEHLCEEIKRKIGDAQRGEKHHLWGKNLSIETKRKISESRKGRHCSDETRKKISETLKGKPINEERRKKISDTLKKRFLSLNLRKKQSEYRKGKPHSIETRIKMSQMRKGQKCYNWKGGITPIVERIRNCFQYTEWRKSCFIRDNFTCQKCGVRGVYLEVHHKKPFCQLIQDAKNAFPDLDWFESCMIYSPLWDIANGMTYCKECHKLTRKK
jgi:5-methylcytosine-specific restriction endonuclease McrA